MVKNIVSVILKLGSNCLKDLLNTKKPLSSSTSTSAFNIGSVLQHCEKAEDVWILVEIKDFLDRRPNSGLFSSILCQCFYKGWFSYEDLRTMQEIEPAFFTNYIWLKNVCMANGKATWNEVIPYIDSVIVKGDYHGN